MSKKPIRSATIDGNTGELFNITPAPEELDLAMAFLHSGINPNNMGTTSGEANALADWHTIEELELAANIFGQFFNPTRLDKMLKVLFEEYNCKEVQMDNELDVIFDNAGVKEDYPDFKDPNKIHSPRAEFKSQILAYVDKRERLARIEELERLLKLRINLRQKRLEGSDDRKRIMYAITYKIKDRISALTNSKVTEGE